MPFGPCKHSHPFFGLQLLYSRSAEPQTALSAFLLRGKHPLQYGVDIIIAAGKQRPGREKLSLNDTVPQLCQLCQIGAVGAEGYEPRARNAAVGEGGFRAAFASG